MTELNVDLSPFDKDNNDKAKIGEGLWVPCRICENMFKRIRLTLRYCNNCGVGFCEGEHGTFEGKRGGYCVQCRKKVSEL